MSVAELANVPIETLQKELAKRLAQVEKLKAQRDILDQQIRQLEGAAGFVMESSTEKSSSKPGRKPGRKPRAGRGGAKTLGQYVAEVLAAAPAGLRINAIEQAVIKAGYVTKAESIYNPILKVIREGGFKKVARGIYASQAAGKTLAKPAGKATKAAKKAAPPKTRKREKYAQTAEQFVLGLVKDKGAITSDINRAWQAAGRKGRADNTLNKMLKLGKLKREKLKGTKGSIYTVAW